MTRDWSVWNSAVQPLGKHRSPGAAQYKPWEQLSANHGKNLGTNQNPESLNLWHQPTKNLKIVKQIHERIFFLKENVTAQGQGSDNWCSSRHVTILVINCGFTRLVVIRVSKLSTTNVIFSIVEDNLHASPTFTKSLNFCLPGLLMQVTSLTFNFWWKQL